MPELLQNFLLAFLYYIKVGGVEILLLFLVFQYAFFGYHLAVEFRSRVLGTVVPRYTRDILKFILFFHLALIVFLVSIGFLISLVNSRAAQVDVNQFNYLYMEWDRRLFGSYLPLWFQYTTNSTYQIWSFLTPYAITIFKQMALVISMTSIIFLLFSTKEFLRFTFALVLTTLISIPFWYATPSLSPMQGYLDNLLQIEIPPSIVESLNKYDPNPHLESFFDTMRTYQSDGEGGRILNYTTMPSMHVGWTSVVVFFLIRFKRWIAVVAVPFFLINFLATILLVQHYAVDPFAGIVVAACAIFLSMRLITHVPEYMQKIDQMALNDREWIVQQYQRVRQHLF